MNFLKKALNDDFYENAKINGIVSYIYYPTGEAKQGHSELEIEGCCWGTIFALEKFESLEKKIKRSTTKDPFKPWKMKGRFFKKYTITVSPKQLEQLKNELYEPKTRPTKTLGILQEISSGLTYKTCSYNVLTLLSNNSEFKVPIPYKISPFLTELYIKKTKPSEVKEIKKYGNKIGYDGEIFESSMIFLTLSIPIIICYTILLNYS